jgi:hypothetical protein
MSALSVHECDFEGTDGRYFHATFVLLPVRRNETTVIFVLCHGADLRDSQEMKGDALWGGYGGNIFTGVNGCTFNSISEAISAINTAALNSHGWKPRFVD